MPSPFDYPLSGGLNHPLEKPGTVGAPGTGTPEVGGLTPREAIQLLRGLSGIDIVGGDVVEVAPEYDPTSNTAQVAAQMLFQLLCLVALKP